LSAPDLSPIQICLEKGSSQAKQRLLHKDFPQPKQRLLACAMFFLQHPHKTPPAAPQDKQERGQNISARTLIIVFFTTPPYICLILVEKLHIIKLKECNSGGKFYYGSKTRRDELR
jgi:hypothetical protein